MCRGVASVATVVVAASGRLAAVSGLIHDADAAIAALLEEGRRLRRMPCLVKEPSVLVSQTQVPWPRVEAVPHTHPHTFIHLHTHTHTNTFTHTTSTRVQIHACAHTH